MGTSISSYSITGQIWIDKNKQSFISPENIRLLNTILSEGNLHNAAQKLGISYRCALKLVEEINQQTPKPIMIRKRGLEPKFTEYGEHFLLRINQMEIEFSSFLLQLNAGLDLTKE